MRIALAVALVLFVSGIFYRLKPNWMKYGWWGKDPVHRRMVTEESHLRYMRKTGIVCLISGFAILLVCLIIYLTRK